MRYITLIFILNMHILCAPTDRTIIQQGLHQLHASLQRLYSQTPAHIRIAMKIINHFHTHNHLVWSKDLPNMTFEKDVAPQESAITSSIYDMYPTASSQALQQLQAATKQSHIAQSITREIKGWRYVMLQGAEEEKNNPFLSIGEAIIQNNVKAISNTTIKEAQSFYKIHLMPHPKEVPQAIEHILQELSRNQQQLRHIYAIKFSSQFRIVLHKPTPLYTHDIAFIFPQIVIYPIHDKKAVEQCMRWLIDIFEGWKGTDLYPRFNTKVNSLIYYIQGNADDRFETNTAHLFDPATDYTFLDMKPFKQYSDVFTIFDTQKLVNPDTGQPFDTA